MSRFTRVAGLHHGMTRDSHHPRKKATVGEEDIEGDATEGQDKNRGDAGTEDGGETTPAPKVIAPEPINAADVETTQK